MDKVFYTVEGNLVVLTINRVEAMNAYDAETVDQLGKGLERFDDDPKLRVAILTGAGSKAFCAGADLKKAPRPVLRGRHS